MTHSRHYCAQSGTRQRETTRGQKSLFKDRTLLIKDGTLGQKKMGHWAFCFIRGMFSVPPLKKEGYLLSSKTWYFFNIIPGNTRRGTFCMMLREGLLLCVGGVCLYLTPWSSWDGGWTREHLARELNEVIESVRILGTLAAPIESLGGHEAPWAGLLSFFGAGWRSHTQGH